ncbi:MAG: hypothetical protein GY757_53615 [bacterium]|nr:hypothetical protein [bacterium]
MFIAISRDTRLDYLINTASIEEVRIIGAENFDRADPRDPLSPGIDYAIEALKTDGTITRLTDYYVREKEVKEIMRELTEALQDRDLIININTGAPPEPVKVYVGLYEGILDKVEAPPGIEVYYREMAKHDEKGKSAKWRKVSD